jgi:long-chain acyl-CoA synthetase
MKLGTILSAQARRFPDKEAAICGGRRLSYGELDRRSDRLANALGARGLRPGDRVLLSLDNSVAFAEAFCGVVKAGGIVVPVNPRLAPGEVAFIAQDCTPKVLVFDPVRREVLRGAAAAGALPVASADAQADEADLDGLVAAGAPAPPPRLAGDFDDCLICYTSGTTGRPKGAILTHANLVVLNLINAVEWGIGAEDRFLVTTPLAHRTGLARLCNALSLGATLVIMARFDAAETVATVERERVTVMGMVPTVARLLMAEIERDPRRCASVRVMLVTGEAFPVEVKQRLLALLPEVQLESFFAMTEAGVVTSLGPAEQISHGASVGRALPGVEVRLVDDSGGDVGEGEAGEVLVRAGEPGRYVVMRGYYQRAEETAAAFKDGWFATGDVARRDADGYYYIVDRKKDMILSGGYNIYSKEVEQALLAHAAVNDAAVIGLPDAVFGESVVAVVELKPGASASEVELIDHCRTLIASYKKPKRVHFRALPRNSLGKVLKFALRDELRNAR